MSARRFSTCLLCPRLCRTSCPVATGAALETAVPSFIASVVDSWERGGASREEALHVATLCTDCGACQDRCHLHQPLPQWLREVRSQLVSAPTIAPLQPIEGDYALTVVSGDDRPFGSALATALGRPVSTWHTTDRLGVAAMEHAEWEAHCAALRLHATDRELVVTDGGIARSLTSAGVAFQWLHALVEGLGPAAGSCATGDERPLACCGGAGPLAAHHPDVSRRVAGVFVERMEGDAVHDARCKAHLDSCGHAVRDDLDRLLARAT